MDFEHETTQVKDTLIVMAETQRRQGEVRRMQAEGIAVHEQRMAHIDMRLAEITDKMDGLIGFRGGFFEGRK